MISRAAAWQQAGVRHAAIPVSSAPAVGSRPRSRQSPRPRHPLQIHQSHPLHHLFCPRPRPRGFVHCRREGATMVWTWLQNETVLAKPLQVGGMAVPWLRELVPVSASAAPLEPSGDSAALAIPLSAPSAASSACVTTSGAASSLCASSILSLNSSECGPVEPADSLTIVFGAVRLSEDASDAREPWPDPGDVAAGGSAISSGMASSSLFRCASVPGTSP